MATLYITEYSDVLVVNGLIQMPSEPPLVEQTVAIGASAALSNAFNPATRFVELNTDAICSILFGSAPVATTASKRLAAGANKFHAVLQASGQPQLKVSVIANT
jgi:hypothetical protein